MLGIKALADLGAKWINRAVERVPRLTEAMLGKQEGSLRELLRQFREGDVERALRHALPLGGDGGRGGLPSADGKLPTVDPTYSLQSLLGSGRGPRGIWFGGFDVQAELAREYRKAAEEAERRGDYRRAAYIHGKLLNDFATAAHLLARGGLHRDAAVSTSTGSRTCRRRPGRSRRRAKSTGPGSSTGRRGCMPRPATCSAGSARRTRRSPSILGRRPPGRRHPARPIAAGDLLRDRARRPDLAMTDYARGWEGRYTANAVLAGTADGLDPRRPGRTPAPGYPRQPGRHAAPGPGRESSAVEFYNELASLAERDALAEIRDEFAIVR